MRVTRKKDQMVIAAAFVLGVLSATAFWWAVGLVENFDKLYPW